MHQLHVVPGIIANRIDNFHAWVITVLGSKNAVPDPGKDAGSSENAFDSVIPVQVRMGSATGR